MKLMKSERSEVILGEGEVRVEAWYCGKRLTKHGKLVFVWLIDDKERWYAQRLAPAQIGEKWLLTQSGDSTVVKGVSRPVLVEGAWHVDQAKWVVAQEADNDEYYQIRADAKLAKRRSDFERALEPLRRLLVAAEYNKAERSHFINRVVQKLWEV